MKVVNVRKEKCSVYIGRPSIFGNPFVIGKDGNREQVIVKYKEYALNNSKLLVAIKGLKDNDVLGCYCAPLACHGDVIVQIWKGGE